jgi:hypothetical protein
MGLDMYLMGKKYVTDNETMECDGLTVTELIVEISYWRKHPNLHGYIVNTFANGKDECQDIGLGEDEVEDIIKAVKEQRLPHTEGFFFGQSDLGEEQIKEDVEAFEKALKWLKSNPENGHKYLVYKASW